ncbi:PrsW family intramembrane metalloprotease [Deinococcus taeanensis]|uniref:PrsW family intramembrane metalloprotease n=1 Tax=Deinococcus taeanensis TaxID=2737050 RepID=UPI001CDD8148|nr:PrsW family glutamic-type intramembrane protease [Deinococcus taeanensis]UBV42805.1 PrsW family intramembrane metalloprotease [Deinococcus taeanensis]
MTLLFSLLSSAALTFAWLWFFVRRDRHPEPLWLLARTFAWGMLAWVIAAALETSLGRLIISPVPFAAALVVVLTALIEEGFKFVAATTAITELSFDEPMDGLIYAVTAALGFALMENATYTLGFGSGAGVWHAVLATLAHALFSAPQGYALGGLHWQQGRTWVVQGLILSVVLHAVFNGLLAGGSSWVHLLALGVVVALMVALATRYYLTFEAHARRYGPSAYFLSEQARRARQ